MKCMSLQTHTDQLTSDLEAWKDENIQLLLLFSSTQILKSGDIAKTIHETFPDAQLIGCSTSGEIGEGVEDDSISLMAMTFKQSQFKCIAVPVESADGSKAAGEKVAKELLADDLKGVFTLTPGVNVNGSKFVLGLKEILPHDISLSGGLAGDGLNFQETLTVFNGNTYTDHAVAFGVYGDHIKIKSGSRGGWKPFGPVRRVTKAENNVLYELDGKSALALYKEYLGDKASDLPASGLLYPFAIMDSEKTDAVGLIRTILDIDEDNNSLILAGDLNVGQHVCLMHANTDELVDGAEDAAKEAASAGTTTNDSAIICVSCVGRKLLMGDDTEDELDAVKSVFKDNAHTIGFYSYGEICHFQDTGEPELHNQTMTITYITEDAA